MVHFLHPIDLINYQDFMRYVGNVISNLIGYLFGIKMIQN